MSLGPEIASALIGLEVSLDQQGVDAAAVKAAAQFNRTFANAQKSFAARDKASQAAAAESIAKAFGGMARQLDIVTPKLNAFQRANQSVNTTITKFGGAMTAAAVGVAALTAVAVKLTVSFAKVAGNFQELEQGINAIIENSETANTTTEKFIGSLKSLALVSGRSSIQLANTGRQFLALGFSGAETTDILKTFTKAAALTGATNQQLGLALNGVSQIASKGAVSMEELRRQIAENLPGAVDLSRFFEILAVNMGVTEKEARKLQGQGLVGAEVGIKSLLQTVNEATEGIDVFALRAQTLNGLIGIMQEGFLQAVQVGFKPFIEAITTATEGPLGALVSGLQKGGGVMAGVTGLLERLGKVLGESFRDILNEILPLLPGLAELFVTLVEALAPVVVEAVKIGATVGKILIPVFIFLAKALDVILNKIPILSPLLRTIAAALLTGGILKGFALFGRALGSIGGLVGRLATPVSKLLTLVSDLAIPVTKLAAVIGLLKGPLGEAAEALQPVISRVGDLLSKLREVSHVDIGISAIKSLGNAIGDIFSDDSADKVGKVFDPIKKVKQPIVDTTAAFENLNTALTSVIDTQDKLKKLQEDVDSAIQNRLDAIKDEADARRDVVDAIQNETDAKEKLNDINIKLAGVEAERQKVFEDTASDIREITEAQRDLEKVGFRLLDIDAERLDVLEKIKELQSPATADEVADADNKITRATIALNRAKREEQELLDSLNKTQETSVDLSGLTLDQLRTRLAGIRLSLAAQRSIVKTGKSAEEIQEDLTLAHLNTVDAQIQLNEAIAGRTALDNQVINNQKEVERLTRRIKEIDAEKLGLLDEQILKQGTLATLQAGETTRAQTLKQLDIDIAGLKRDQRDATRDVQTATADIQIKQDAVKIATDAIKKAEQEIRQAKKDQNFETTILLGTERDINQALQDRIGLNGQLGKQTAQIVAQSLITNFIPNLADIDKVGVEAFVGTSIKNPNFAKQLADMILNNPNKLRDLLRFVGITGFEQGGLITHPQIAMVGERFKHEMVLPLSKPDRVWSLLSQTLPKYPGALRAAQSALGPAPIMPMPIAGNLGSRRVVPRDEGPATFGQIQELIAVLREQRTEVHIEAPITVENTGSDDLLIRKLSRKLKREILDELGRR